MRSIKAALAVVLLSLPVAIAAPGCAAASGDGTDSTEHDSTAAPTAGQEDTPLRSDDEAVGQSTGAPDDVTDTDDADEDEVGQVDQGLGESADALRPHARRCHRVCQERFQDCRRSVHHGRHRCKRQLDRCLSSCVRHRKGH